MGVELSDVDGRDPDVFISYSRQDAAFVTRLARALAERGKTPWLDVEGIEDGEVFPAVLREAIERTDGMVFVISPAAAGSPFCHQEVDHALALGKRIVPVLYRPVPDDQLPPGIRERQWVQVGRSLRPDVADRLVRALDADPDHTRQHTKVLLRARDWQDRGRTPSALARGEELAEAEAWLTRAQGREPAPTELQAAWIAAGRRAVARRQRTVTLTSLAVSVLALALLAFALFSRAQAVDARAQADGARAAEHSRALAAEADGQLSRDPQLSILLAEEALKAKATPEAMLAATRALDANTARSQMPSLGAQPCVQAMRMVPLAGGHQVAVTTCDGRLVREDLDHQHIGKSVRVGTSAGPVARSAGTLAVGTASGITMVDAHDWTVRGRIHTPYPINALAFDAAHRYLAVAAPDRVALVALRRHKIRTVARTKGPFDNLLNVAWADRHTILAGGFDVPPQSRSFVTGLATINIANGHVRPVHLTGGTDKPLAVAVPGPVTSNVEGITVSPDGGAWFIAGKLAPSLATSGGRAEVWRVDPRTRRVVWRAAGPSGQYATSAALSPDGSRLAVGYALGLASVLDARSGEPLLQLPGHTNAVRGVLFRNLGAPVVTASQDGVVRTWAGQGTERVRRTMPKTAQVLMSPAAAHEVVAFGNGGRQVTIDSRTGSTIQRGRRIPLDAIASVISDGRLAQAYVRQTSRGDLLTVFDGRTGATIGQPRPFRLGIALGVSGTGLVLTAHARADGTVRPRLLDPRSGHSRAFEVGPALCGLSEAGFSPDSSRVELTDGCGLIETYDVRSGRLLSRVQLTDRTTANGAAWAPDSRHVYFGVAGGSLVVVDAVTGEVRERPGSQEQANSVAASPDGRFVAVGGSDGIVDVYDARTLRLVRQHVLPRPVKAVALGTDSLAVLDEHYTMRIWDTCAICENASALQRRMQTETVRTLTPAERATFGA